MVPRWLDIALKLQAIAQNGLTYAKDPFDAERYEAVREIAADMMSEQTGEEPERILDLFRREQGYATPKVDVRAAVFQDDAILLVKERQDGLWTLPGGWVDVGDPPSEAVEREVREESGYEVRAVKLLALYDRNKHDHSPLPYHIYKLFFLCELVGGTPSESIETAEAGFFRPDDVPPLSRTRVTPQQISRLFEHYHNPEWPTDFD